MQIRMPLRHILNPSSFVLITALMSAAAWSVPSLGVLRKGFATKADMSFFAFLMLLSWYLLICCSFYIGQKFGVGASKMFPVNRSIFDIDHKRYLYLYTLLTAVGLVITYQKIFSGMTPAMAYFYVTNHQANQLKESLYDNYSAGIMSLRYLIVFSSTLAFRRYLKYRKISPIIIANLLLLVLVSVLSARLLVVASLLNIVFTCNFFKTQLRVKAVKVTLTVLAFFTVMSLFNMSRNGDYYDQINLSFWEAGFSEIITYLGSPFQVAVGGANNISKEINVPSETYRDLVDVEDDLNTNSAFIFLHEAIGFWAWPYITLLTLFMGFLFRYFVGHGATVFMLSSGAILYASAELWRLDLFQQGIFMTWLVCSISIPIAANAPYFLGRLLRPGRSSANA